MFEANERNSLQMKKFCSIFLQTMIGIQDAGNFTVVRISDFLFWWVLLIMYLLYSKIERWRTHGHGRPAWKQKYPPA